MFVSLSEKKKFLTWLVNTVPFGRREVLWILNYLLTHDAILNNVHFVENVEKTDRGIRVVADGLGKEPLLLFIQAQEFTDPEQIFHEIRMNWRKALYLECVFPEAWQKSQYLSVLEDNPFAPWNEQVDQEVARAIDQYFKQEEQTQRMALLKAQIDDALETGNKEAFLELSDELNRLKQQ